MRQKLFHAYSVCGKNYSTPTQCAVKIYVGVPTVAVFFSSLLCNVYACDGSHVFAVVCETAVAVGSLESIPGLSLSPYLETFKEPRNRFQGTREPRNPGTKNRLSVSARRGVADSPYQRVGESLSDLQ